MKNTYYHLKEKPSASSSSEKRPIFIGMKPKHSSGKSPLTLYWPQYVSSLRRYSRQTRAGFTARTGGSRTQATGTELAKRHCTCVSANRYCTEQVLYLMRNKYSTGVYVPSYMDVCLNINDCVLARAFMRVWGGEKERERVCVCVCV